MTGPKTPALLCILDGYGLEAPGKGNAIASAETPVMDALMATRPHTTLCASGPSVGLPEGQMGNSEVGHLNIGAGRIVFQELSRINNAIEDGSLFENEELCKAVDAAVCAGAAVHCMGLLSDGGVHSEFNHLIALLELACKRGAKRVYVHAFTDGRDVEPGSCVGFIEKLSSHCGRLSRQYGVTCKIATVCGRFYAMDRDTRWERVNRAYDLLTQGIGTQTDDVLSAVGASLDAGVTDEFIEPIHVSDTPSVSDGDALLFFNFRPDRAREITRAFTDPDFSGFVRGVHPEVHFVCLTEYDPTIPAPIAFPKTIPDNVLADYLSSLGLSQFHIAETEKYAHVTFFLNGGAEDPKAGEERVLIPSPKEVPTYDEKPQMSAPEVAERLVRAIDSDEADVYIVNFANCDMVGHTGVIPAAIAAVEAVDTALGQVLEALDRKHGVGLVTADHGNADKMLSDDGSTPFTAHTLAPVPFIIVGDTQRSFEEGKVGCLADIAPTLIDLMGLEKPAEWTGSSLLS